MTHEVSPVSVPAERTTGVRWELAYLDRVVIPRFEEEDRLDRQRDFPLQDRERGAIGRPSGSRHGIGELRELGQDMVVIESDLPELPVPDQEHTIRVHGI